MPFERFCEDDSFSPHYGELKGQSKMLPMNWA
jgi:hypothetical protein